MTTSPRHGLTDLEQGQAIPEDVVNENDRRLEQAGNQFIVKDKDLATPPGSPAEGDAYIVAASPTGDWTGHATHIAYVQNGAWEFITPIEGTRADVQDEDIEYRFSGSVWAVPTSAGSYDGGPVTAATTADLATWLNQGTSSVSDGTGALILLPQVDGLVHGREKTAPGTPYDIYMKLDFDFASSAATNTAISAVAGILLRDNSDGELLVCGIYFERVVTTPVVHHGAIIQRWTNSTTFSATPLLRYNNKPWSWVRINNNGTTITFYASQDGKNWTQIGTETIATFVDTIDRIGVVCISSANTTAARLSVPYFSTTAPS